MQIYKSLLIHFCSDYRPCLCWQMSSILFSIIISSFDFNLPKSLISRRNKSSLHHKPSRVRLMFDTIGQRISLAKSRSTQSLGLNLCKHLAVYLSTRSSMWLTFIPSLKKYSLWSKCMEYKRNEVWTTTKLKNKAEFEFLIWSILK